MRFCYLSTLYMLVLTGCGLPPAVTVASFVADGFSYVATGKSTTDHALSAVVGEDCALLRAAQEKPICDPNGEVIVELKGAPGSPKDWNDPSDIYLIEYDDQDSSISFVQGDFDNFPP